MAITDRFVLNPSASDGAEHQTRRVDKHLRAGILRRAADGFHERHRHKRPAGGRKFGELFDKTVGDGHVGKVEGRKQKAKKVRRLYQSTIVAPIR